MKTTSEKITLLRDKINTTHSYTVMIVGLGSVGSYLLDYLVSCSDPRMCIVVVGRNRDKLTTRVNIVKTAATIRSLYRCKIHVDDNCNLENIESITSVINRWKPDFIVNSSRAYPGLKYGSISWPNLRAYGIWAPLSAKLASNIMRAYASTDGSAITINTSYSDAVIPWIKSAGLPYYDFGSGNLNHLIPRIKFYIQDKYGIENTNDIDVTLAASHFHDVVVCKEGHTEHQDIPLDIRIKGQRLQIDKDEVWGACSIPMPTDQTRNMMNASSNYAIINGIIRAIDNNSQVKLHIPGASGEIGGFPYIVDCTTNTVIADIDTSIFCIDLMRQANRKSIYLDGIENVEDGKLIYTDELVNKVNKRFGIVLPKVINYDEMGTMADWLINNLCR